MRRRFFRGLHWKLECGHEVDTATSFYRLDGRRLACLIGSYYRSGVFCMKCKATCQPTEMLGIVRISEAKA